MIRALAVLRSLVYMSAFVLFWVGLALLARRIAGAHDVGLPDWLWPIGSAMTIIGGVIAVGCGLTLAVAGLGTPAHFDAPRQFVAVGPYRSVRNPMYIGAFIAIVGFALFERSLAMLLFTLLPATYIWFMAVRVEEPALERQFGESYLAYKRSVRRWLPKWPARSSTEY